MRTWRSYPAVFQDKAKATNAGFERTECVRGVSDHAKGWFCRDSRRLASAPRIYFQSGQTRKRLGTRPSPIAPVTLSFWWTPALGRYFICSDSAPSQFWISVFCLSRTSSFINSLAWGRVFWANAPTPPWLDIRLDLELGLLFGRRSQYPMATCKSHQTPDAQFLESRTDYERDRVQQKVWETEGDRRDKHGHSV
jgi:hypothetical protein